ncbi:MAG: error-prone DNA polymerase [Phycisphaerales bacterium]|jgi:error-prone DNA polymerase|nr:error-prone DNA polymerase [Phycisphaerales bacterium]
MSDYCELEVTTNFTFLTGASHPEEYVRTASDLGYESVAITDTDSVGGLVRAHVVACEVGIRLICGVRLRLQMEYGVLEVLVYPTDLASWGGLCRLLTLGRCRAGKGECELYLQDLIHHHVGLLAVVAAWEGGDVEAFCSLERLRSVFDDDRLSLAVHRHFGGEDDVRSAARVAMAARAEVPPVVTNNVQFHKPQRRRLHDVLACVRMHCTLDEAGTRLVPNSEQHLKSAGDMATLFADLPCAVSRSSEIADRVASGFSLSHIRYAPPRDNCPRGDDEDAHLRTLTDRGLRHRYPHGVPDCVADQVERELSLIAELGYASYFLTVHDIVCFARRRRILCQGRGSAANSAVCWALSITAVDPERGNLLFERFLSRERGEPPDIDIDFEHERREEVIQYIYGKYGRDRAALCATTITYRWRSAIRDVGRVFGLSMDVVERLAKEGASSAQGRGVVDLAVEVAGWLRGFPRHRSQHVGGFVITESALESMVPIEIAAMEDRTVIEWDKDDIEALGILKIDVLGLGMLTCIRRCLDEIPADPPLSIATIPPEDSAVYDMCCRADTVGVFQIESRAQMAMLPRMRPRCFYDLVVEIALVRPGPIQGGMVHPYLRRREGTEAISYPNDAVRSVLERTLGVPIFQEQAMRLAMVAGGFSADKAEHLRRAMGAWKRRPDTMRQIGAELVEGMRARGYEPDFIDRCWKQIHGFSEYGFPESHSASFALLVYASAWLKCHHPAAFACALLNSQPMGFYAPAQIVRCAKEHGVEVRPIDVNHSVIGCTLEDSDGPHPALRLGLRMVRGLSRDDASSVCAAVADLGEVLDLWSLRSRGVGPGALRAMARADAFGSLSLERQAALWEITLIERGTLPLFPVEGARKGPAETRLPEVTLRHQVVQDYCATGLSLKAHPISFMRTWLEARGAVTAGALNAMETPLSGERPRRVAAGGLVLVRQQPHSAKGMVFMTIEDETGIVNIVMGPNVYRRCRAAVRLCPAVIVYGVLQRRGEVVHLKAEVIAEAAPSIGDALHHAVSVHSWR